MAAFLPSIIGPAPPSPVIQRRRDSLANEQPDIVYTPFAKQGFVFLETAPTQWTKTYAVVKHGAFFCFAHKPNKTLAVTSSTQASICSDPGPTYRDPETGESVGHPHLFTVTVEKQTLTVACQNPATRKAWINVLSETDDAHPSKGCVGYLLVKTGRSKWARRFFSLYGATLQVSTPKVVASARLASFDDAGFEADAAVSAQLGVSVARSSVAATLADPDTGKVAFGHRLAILDGKNRISIAVKSADGAEAWQMVLDEAVSANAYKRAAAVARVHASATATIDPGAVTERELIFIASLLDSPAYGAVRAGLWAFSALTANGANRVKMASPDMFFFRSLLNAAASDALANCPALATDLARTLNNLATTPRVFSELFRFDVVAALTTVLASASGPAVRLGLRAIKLFALHDALDHASLASLHTLVHAAKRAAAADDPMRRNWKEVAKLLASRLAPASPPPPTPAPADESADAHPAPADAPADTENSAPLQTTNPFDFATPVKAPAPATHAKLISFSPAAPGPAPLHENGATAPLNPALAALVSSAPLLPSRASPASPRLDDSFEMFMRGRAASAAAPPIAPHTDAPVPAPAAAPFDLFVPTTHNQPSLI